MIRSKLYNFNEDKLGLDFISNYEVNNGLDLSVYTRYGLTFPKHVVTSVDIGRPDLISKKLYGSAKYWSILFNVNGIFDPFNDLYIGQRLNAPPLNIIEDYYTRCKKEVKGDQ